MRSGGATRGNQSVAVIGAGYVGLPTAAVLAHFGHRVVCAERDANRFRTLVSGQIPIVEDGLEELVRESVENGRLTFVADAVSAVQGADYVFLCVPTPETPDGSADLHYVTSVAAEIGSSLAPSATVINKSTVPVGTAALVKQISDRHDISVVSNPEFLREGTAVHDSLRPDRIVVGADDRRAAARVAELFAPSGAPVIVTDTVTAETIKYASNAFLATKLSFVNTVASLCESLGADVRDLILGVGYDHRIGPDFLRPGPGWGGSCLPKDTVALITIARDVGYDFTLLRAAIEANQKQRRRIVDKVMTLTSDVRDARDSLVGVNVCAWGLSFKAGTDDRRMSPAIAIIRALVEMGASVQAYDPTAPPLGEQSLLEEVPEVVLRTTPYEAARDAHVIVLLTEWDEFRALDFLKVASIMVSPRMVDARNVLDPVALRHLGFMYTAIGCP